MMRLLMLLQHSCCALAWRAPLDGVFCSPLWTTTRSQRAAVLLKEALDPLSSPLLSVDVTLSHTVKLHAPEDDAVMEAAVAAAHRMALAAGPDRYDEVMEAHCAMQRPAYWAQLWPSSLALSRWILTEPTLVEGKSVLELGCGLGMGAVCSALAGARSCDATDGAAAALPFAAANAETNGVAELVRARLLDWEEEVEAREAADADLSFVWRCDVADSDDEEEDEDTTLATAEGLLSLRYDVVLAADIVYDESAPDLLARLLPRLVAAGGTLLIADNADRPYKEARRDALLRRLCAAEGGTFERVKNQRTVRTELKTRQGEAFDVCLGALTRLPDEE